MTEQLQAQAILLHTRPLREADLLITVLSLEEGKFTGVAPSARRSRKRFGGGLEPGTIGSIRYNKKPQQSLVQVHDIQVQARPPRTQISLQHFAAYGIMLNIADIMSVDLQPATEKYAVLHTALSELQERDPIGVVSHFLVRWLRATGFAPSMAHCTRCEQQFEDAAPSRFVPSEGGCVCAACGPIRTWSHEVSVQERQAWIALEQSPRCDTHHIAQHDTLFRIGVWQYVQSIAERPVRAAGYWEMLWNMDSTSSAAC